MTLYAARPGTPKSVRKCVGYVTKDGPVICDTSMAGTPQHKKRCAECARLQEIHRDRLRDRRPAGRGFRPVPPPRQCAGFDTDDVPFLCANMVTGRGNRKRCDDCALGQRKYSHLLYERSGARNVERKATGGNNHVHANGATKEEHTPHRHCRVCCDMPHAREPGRIADDGHPILGADGLCRGCDGYYAPLPPPEAMACLGSSMAATVKHGELYGMSAANDTLGNARGRRRCNKKHEDLKVDRKVG